jgi:hypothetical protein
MERSRPARSQPSLKLATRAKSFPRPVIEWHNQVVTKSTAGHRMAVSFAMSAAMNAAREAMSHAADDRDLDLPRACFLDFGMTFLRRTVHAPHTRDTRAD